jgi:hypothetical protein
MSTETNVEASAEQPAEQPDGGKKKRKRRVRKPTAKLGLLTLPGLAEELGLPLRWLRREVSQGHLPTMEVGGRLLFDPKRVARILQDRAFRNNQYGEYVRT